MNNKFIKIYVNFLEKFLKPARPLKVIFDCSNGTTGLVLKNLFKPLNFKTYKLINSVSDGNFPGHGPNPWAEGAMGQLKKEVLRQRADLGIIFDADGDRVFFVDNLSRIIEPDIIARLLIWQLQPKKVVYDIRTGWLVKKYQVSGIKYQVSKVGHYFIKKLMRKINADLGVEKSGHYYFSVFGGEKSYCDAGILTAIEIINAVSKLPYSLADFSDLLPQYYHSGELNIKMNNELRIKNYEYLLKNIEKYFKLKAKSYKIEAISYLDGLTMEFEGWWFNLRPSNTEPLIRLNIEAENKILLKNKKAELIKLLNTNNK